MNLKVSIGAYLDRNAVELGGRLRMSEENRQAGVHSHFSAPLESITEGPVLMDYVNKDGPNKRSATFLSFGCQDRDGLERTG